MVQLHYEEVPEIPPEWVEIIEKLHPITAVVVWAVLNNDLTPEIIRLAKYSPDIRRYDSIEIVAGGNPQSLQGVTELAYKELFGIFADLLDNPRTQLLQ